MKLKVGHIYFYHGKNYVWANAFEVIEKNYSKNTVTVKVLWDNKADGMDWTNRILTFNLDSLENQPEDVIREMNEEDIVLEMI